MTIAVPKYFVEVGPTSGGEPRRRMRQDVSPHGTVTAAIACLLVMIVGRSVWLERYEVWALLSSLCALGALVWSSSRLRVYRPAVIFVGVTVGLVFFSLWSLDEHMHVTVTATSHGYRATVNNESIFLPVTPRNGQIALYTGRLRDLYVGPVGEARPIVAGPLGSLGERAREAGPGVGWRNIIVRDQPSRSRGQARYRSPQGWAVNRRGEAVGALGSSALLNVGRRARFVLSADVMRSDGVQGVVVGLDRGGDGYVILTKMDLTTPLDPADPRAPNNLVWMHWRNHPEGPVLARRQLRYVDGISMVRRDARVVLPSVVAAWLLIMGCMGSYGILAGLCALVRWRSGASRPRRPWTTETWPDWFALAVIAGSFVLTAFVSRYLEVIPHIADSTAYLFQAKTLAQGHLWAPAPQHPEFFYQPFIVVDHGRWFSKYPPGWPLLLAAGVRLGVPWLINPVLSAGALGLVYLTGRRIYGMRVALLATVMLSTSPLFLGLGGSFMAHTSGLFFLVGFTYLFVRWVQKSELHGSAYPGSDWKLLFPAGLSLGVGFSIREFDVLPLLLPCAWLVMSRPFVHRLRSCLWISLGAAGPAALLALYNARLTGNMFTSPYTLWWSFDRLGFGAKVGSYRFTVPISLWHTSMNLEMLQADLFGWPFYAGLALVSTPFLLGRAIRWDWFFAISALLTVVAYGFYFNPGGAYLPRYYFSAFPAFAFLAAHGVQELGRLPSRVLVRGAQRDSLALVPPLVLIATCLLYSVGASLPAHAALLHDYAGVTPQRMEVVRAAHIHDAVVFIQPLHPTPENRLSSYMSTFSSNAPTLDGDVILARDLGARDRTLMRAYPDRAYYRLRQYDPEQVYFRWLRLDEMRWEPLRPVFRLTKLTGSQSA